MEPADKKRMSDEDFCKRGLHSFRRGDPITEEWEDFIRELYAEAARARDSEEFWSGMAKEWMKDLTINELIKQSHETAKEKGWWNPWERNVGEQLALFHSEVSEALEEWRNGKPLTEVYTDENGKPCGFPIELADLFIRVADTCGRYGVDLQAALKTKLEFNKHRPRRHGGKLA